MSRQGWEELIVYTTADGTPVANTTTESILVPVNTGLIPAYYLADGRTIRVKAYGKFSTTVTPTLLFSLRIGGVAGTLLCKSGALTTPTSGETTGLWVIEAWGTVRSNGSSGTIMMNGEACIYSGAVGTAGAFGPMTVGGQTAPATASVDFTSSTLDLTPTITWGTANASNTITCLQYYVESCN